MGQFAECPVCREPISWTYIWRPLWSQWRCKSCSSLLGIDAKRRLLVIGLSVPAAMASMFYVTRMGYGDLWTAPIVIAPIIILLLLLDRPKIVERASFRCKGCGYDLHGQVVPRCPECGRDLDETERRILESGEIPQSTRQPRRRAILTAVLVIFFVFSLALIGVLKYIRITRSSAALTTQPTTVPTTLTTETGDD